MEDKKVYYTNGIEIEISNYDVKLKLNYTSGVKDGNTTVNLCEVVMSPEHAKKFAKIFTNAMNDYETKILKNELNSKKGE